MTLEGSFWPPPPHVDQHCQRWSFNQVECHLGTPPPRISMWQTLVNPSKVIADPFQVQAIPSKVIVDPCPSSGDPSKVIARSYSKLKRPFQGLCGSFPSWGDPSKVFADPFQVECRLTPPGSALSRGDPSKVIVQILSKLSVDWPSPRSLRILSKLRWSFQSLCRSFPSWVLIDPPPGSALSEVILPKSSQILSKLSVNQPPSPPSPSLPT